MSTTCLPNCLCDCCVGTANRTPVDTVNRQGLETLRYRVGTHGDFFVSMVAALANARIDLASDFAGSAGLGGSLVGGGKSPGINFSEYPLATLTARTTDDPALAFMDAWSVVLDVLSFYQERIANEGYLRTATEFRSLFELAGLVGYSPRPGVAANVFLAYGLEKDSKLVIKAGSRAQSVPESGQEPQSFESCEDFYARDRWNFLAPRKARPQVFEPGQTTAGKRVWFSGLNTLLKTNDPVVIVFDNAKGEPFRVKKIETDNTLQTSMIVLQDFTTMSIPADAKAALGQANAQIQKAIYAFHEANSEARLANPKLENIVESLTKSITTLLAKTSVTIDDAVQGGKQLRIALQNLRAELPATQSSTPTAQEILDDLITRLQGVEEYLFIQTTALFVGDEGKNLPENLNGVDAAIEAEYQTLRVKWAAEYIRNLSPTTLANLLFQTREFIEKTVPEAQKPKLEKALKLVRDALPELVQSIVRGILTRFSHPAQAGVIPDAQIPTTVRNEIKPLQSILTLPNVAPEKLASLIPALHLIPNDKVSVISALVTEANAVRNHIANTGEMPTNLKGLKDAINRLNQIEQAVSEALEKFGRIIEATIDHDFDAIRTSIGKLLNRAKTLGLSIAESALQAAFASIDPGLERADLVLRANVWRAIWTGCQVEVKAYVASLESVSEALTLSRLSPTLPDTPKTMKEAIDDFMGTKAAPKQLQPADPIDVQPDRLCLSSEKQFETIDKLAKKLGEDVSADELLMSLRHIDILNESLTQWFRDIKQALAKFADTRQARNDFKEAVDDATAQLVPGSFPRAISIASAIKNLAGAPRDRDVASARKRIGVLRDLASALPDNLALPLLTASDVVSEVKRLLQARGVTEGLLALLRNSLDRIRQQQRLARDGKYPRLMPWLNEFVESLDQFMSDLALKIAENDSTQTTSNVVGARGEPFPDLKALKLPPSSPPPNSARLERGLSLLTRDTGAIRNGSLIADLGPQIAIAFDGRMAGALYDGFTNAKLARAKRFQGVHVVRARSGPFGHNAPCRPVLKFNGTLAVENIPPPPPPPPPLYRAKPPVEWDLAPTETEKKNVLRLDAVFDKVTPGSFVIIERASPPNNFALDNPLVARVEAVATVSPTDYGAAGATVTQLTLDRPWLTDADVKLSSIRDVTVYLQSEPLELAGEPIDADVGPVPGADDGQSIELDEVYDGLPSGRWLIVSGERTDVPNTTGVKGAELVMLSNASQVVDAEGSPGQGRPHTLLKLANPLSYSYQRGTVTIYSNVVKADQGETKSEILGAGAAAVKGQRFALKQQPLTYVAAATPSGAVDTAQIRVNGVRWHGANRFTELGPNNHGYVLQTDAAGKTYVVFGDGVYGARLPTGIENVRATYRVGMGKSGNVAAGKITNLVSRPLGVKEVTNPMPAVGGVDRETTDQIRRNAPIGVTALDRLVSVQDYEDFARGFAGIEKAYAARLSDGYTQRLHLTIAGRDGGEIPESSDLYRNLLLALRKFGDPALPLTVAPRRLLLIVATIRIRALPDFEFEPVVRAVRERLLQSFGFDRREFGQDVVLSDVIGTIHRVRGVAALVVDRFGLLFERQPDGTPTPLSEIIKQLKEIPAINATQHAKNQTPGASVVKPFRSRLSVAKTTYREGRIVPAELAILSPNVADTLILNEWKT